MSTMPFWAVAALVSDSQPPLDFQVSLEDMVSDSGRLVEGELSRYAAKGTPFVEGDVLFGKLRPYLAKYWLANRKGTAGGDIHVYRPEPNVEPRYLAYIVGSRNFVRFAEAASRGAKMPRVEWMSLREYPVVAQGLDIQRAIADFLDRETGEIDAMIDKMDELAETLRERRKGVASSLYLRGYESVKLKWLMSEVDDRAGSENQELPLLSVSIHYGVQSREESTSNQKASLDLGNYKVARHGQIALNRMRAFQGGLGRVFVDGLVSPDYAVLEPHDQLSSVWAEYVMRTPEFIARMTQRLRGIGAADQSNVRTPRINVSDLVELSIPLPELRVQERVIVQLDEVTGRIDVMLAKVAELKSTLIERRAALITDVVSGQKKVA